VEQHEGHCTITRVAKFRTARIAQEIRTVHIASIQRRHNAMLLQHTQPRLKTQLEGMLGRQCQDVDTGFELTKFVGLGYHIQNHPHLHRVPRHNQGMHKCNCSCHNELCDMPVRGKSFIVSSFVYLRYIQLAQHNMQTCLLLSQPVASQPAASQRQ
jgi:hypothetical protein